MAMIRFKHQGDFRNTERFLNKASKANYMSILKKYGDAGVRALAAATPAETGKTANSWSYTIEGGRGHYEIVWNNSNINDGVSIAIILQLGHGTGTGGFVQGRDYINPAIGPIFDQLANDLYKEAVG